MSPRYLALALFLFSDMHTHAYAHVFEKKKLFFYGIPFSTMSMYLWGRRITPVFTPTVWFVGLVHITFTSDLSARLMSSIIHHTHFTCFCFNVENVNRKMKWLRNRRQSVVQIRSSEFSVIHDLSCSNVYFNRSLSDTSQVQLEQILSWLSPDKMKYCKRAVLFVYLAIGGRARYSLFDCEEFAPSVLCDRTRQDKVWRA